MRTPTAYTEWGGGASTMTATILKAFVAAEITLGSHLAEQLAVAFNSARAAHDRPIPHRPRDEAGYLPPDLDRPRTARSSPEDVEAVLAVPAEIRSARRLCAKLERMPCIQLRELNRYDPAMQALVSI